MRAGVFLAYWPWFTPEEQVTLAVQADQAGLDSVWVAEAWGHAGLPLGAHGADRARHRLDADPGPDAAKMAAMTAVTPDVLGQGRFRLGLGVSGPQVSEGWYGVPFRRPVSRTREYVKVVRAALARKGPLVYDGREFQIPFRADPSGPPAHWPPFLMDPKQADVLFEPLHRGLADTGRTLEAFYLGAMGAKDKSFYVELAERAGHGEAARAVQDSYLGGDRMGAATHVTDALVDSMALAATPATLDDRFAEYEAAAVDTIVGVPCGPDRSRVVSALAEATAGA